VSGPKSVSYRVVETPAQREARERRRLDETHRQLERRQERLLSAATEARAAYGDAIDLPIVAPALAQPRIEDYRRGLERLDEELTTAGHALGAQVIAARKDALIARLGGDSDDRASSASAALRRQRESRGFGTQEHGDSPGDKHRIAEAVGRVVGRLHGQADPREVERIERAAAAIAEQSRTSLADRALTALRADVGQANQAVARERSRRREFDDLRRSLAEAPGPPADGVLGQLDSLESSGIEVTPSLKARVDDAREAAIRAAEREHVSATLKSALTELGYEVGQDFEARLAERGFADVGQPRWRGYALRVRENPAESDLGFHVVRGRGGGQAQAVRDREVEQDWCSDMPQVIASLKEHGIDSAITRQLAPGARPVLVTDDLPAREQQGIVARRSRAAHRSERRADSP